MKKSYLDSGISFLWAGIFLISCGAEETIDLKPNSPPVIVNQQFDVFENTEASRIIARLEASDADGDELRFSLESRDIGLSVHVFTGEIRTTDISVLDYETLQKIEFEVSVRDGKGGSDTAGVKINVLDADDGPLTNHQKSFVDEYIHLVYSLSEANLSESLRSSKWKDEIRLFLDGNFPEEYPNTVDGYLHEFNTFFTDGIALVQVNTLEESNVHLIMGPPSSIEQIWPDMYSIINRFGPFSGYALTGVDSHLNINEGRIWIRERIIGKAIFIHEMGHIIGLGHSSDQYCTGEASFMCSPAAPGFNQFDKEIIKALYQPTSTSGLTPAEMKEVVTEYIIDNSILE